MSKLIISRDVAAKVLSVVDVGLYAASAASAAASAASAKDQVLSLMAEIGVEALQKAGSPGCAWLDLADEREAA